MLVKNDFYFYLFTLLLAWLAYGVQTLEFVNGDVLSLLHDTHLFLQGGTYVTHFFETNPPMIFLLYSPICFITQWFHGEVILTTRIYIICIALFSLLCCDYLLKKIIQPAEHQVRYAILGTLLFVFLFLPTVEFGQREHLYFMLFLPYVLAAVLHAENKSLPVGFAILVGVLAGLSVGMKPYFLGPLILIECYLIYVKRHFWGWCRLEAMVCASILVLYVALVFYFYPEYFYIMLPLISHLYYISIEQPWVVVFSRLPVVFCLFTMIAGLILMRKIIIYRHLTQILHLGLIGGIVAFLLPRAAWFYHVFPAISFASLVITLFLVNLAYKEKQNAIFSKAFISFATVTVFAVPLYLFYFGTHFGMHIKRHSSLNQVIAYINSLNKTPSIYCFSANTTGDCFTLIYFTQSIYHGRYPFFWWMGGLQRLEAKNQALAPKIQSDKQFLIEAIVEDLQKAKPDLLIINRADAKNALGEHFDFAAYFSQNALFRAAWKHYHYFKTLGVFEMYERQG